MSMAAMRMLQGRHKSGGWADGHAGTHARWRRPGRSTLGDLAGALESRMAGRGAAIRRMFTGTCGLAASARSPWRSSPGAALRLRRRPAGRCDACGACSVRSVRTGCDARRLRGRSAAARLAARSGRDRARRTPGRARAAPAADASSSHARLSAWAHRRHPAAGGVCPNFETRGGADPVGTCPQAGARVCGEAIRHVGPLYRPEALHQVRIAGKKLRYALELVQAHGHQPVLRDLATLRRWQAGLGRLNDLHMLQTYLARIASDSASRADRRAVEAMEQAIDVECRGVHARFLGGAAKLLALADRVRFACLTLRRPESTRMPKLPPVLRGGPRPSQVRERCLSAAEVLFPSISSAMPSPPIAAATGRTTPSGRSPRKASRACARSSTGSTISRCASNWS